MKGKLNRPPTLRSPPELVLVPLCHCLSPVKREEEVVLTFGAGGSFYSVHRLPLLLFIFIFHQNGNFSTSNKHEKVFVPFFCRVGFHQYQMKIKNGAMETQVIEALLAVDSTADNSINECETLKQQRPLLNCAKPHGISSMCMCCSPASCCAL